MVHVSVCFYSLAGSTTISVTQWKIVNYNFFCEPRCEFLLCSSNNRNYDCLIYTLD